MTIMKCTSFVAQGESSPTNASGWATPALDGPVRRALETSSIRNALATAALAVESHSMVSWQALAARVVRRRHLRIDIIGVSTTSGAGAGCAHRGMSGRCYTATTEEHGVEMNPRSAHAQEFFSMPLSWSAITHETLAGVMAHAMLPSSSRVPTELQGNVPCVELDTRVHYKNVYVAFFSKYTLTPVFFRVHSVAVLLLHLQRQAMGVTRHFRKN